jgi:hypothetical protein
VENVGESNVTCKANALEVTGHGSPNIV